MLMRNEALARLVTRYDADRSILTISQDGRCAVEADLSVPEGREAVEAFFAREFADALRGPPKLLTAPEGFRFTDSARGFVSLLNLASVAATEDMVGAPVDPLRFRANLHLSGLAPFAELDLVGRVLASKGGVPPASLEADGALRGDECRPGDRTPRPRDPQGPLDATRPYGLRCLCRGAERRPPRTGRDAPAQSRAKSGHNRTWVPAAGQGQIGWRGTSTMAAA